MLHPYPEGHLLTCINSKLVADFNTRLVIISWSKLVIKVGYVFLLGLFKICSEVDSLGKKWGEEDFLLTNRMLKRP